MCMRMDRPRDAKAAGAPSNSTTCETRAHAADGVGHGVSSVRRGSGGFAAISAHCPGSKCPCGKASRLGPASHTAARARGRGGGGGTTGIRRQPTVTTRSLPLSPKSPSRRCSTQKSQPDSSCSTSRNSVSPRSPALAGRGERQGLHECRRGSPQGRALCQRCWVVARRIGRAPARACRMPRTTCSCPAGGACATCVAAPHDNHPRDSCSWASVAVSRMARAPTGQLQVVLGGGREAQVRVAGHGGGQVAHAAGATRVRPLQQRLGEALHVRAARGGGLLGRGGGVLGVC